MKLENIASQLNFMRYSRWWGYWKERENQMKWKWTRVCKVSAGYFDFGRAPWVQFTSSCLFVLPTGKISDLSMNSFHKSNVTISFSFNADSSYCFWTSDIPKAFSKNGSCKTNSLHISPISYFLLFHQHSWPCAVHWV